MGWPTKLWPGWPQVQAHTHHAKGYGVGDDREGSGHLGLFEGADEPELLGFTNPDPAQYRTSEWLALMKREFGDY